MSQEVQMNPEELAEYDAETVLFVELAEAAAMEADAAAEGLKSEYTAAKKLAEHKAAALRALVRERKAGRGKRPEPTLLDGVKADKWRDYPLSKLVLHPDVRAKLPAESTMTLGDLHAQVTTFDPAQGTPFGLTLAECCDVRATIQDIIDREADAIDPATVETIPEDLWRPYPIDRWQRFGLTAKDVEKLAAGELKSDNGRFPIVTVGDLATYSTPNGSGWQRRLNDIKGMGPAGVDRLSEAETKFWKWWRDGGESEYARECGHGAATPARTGSGDTPSPDGGGIEGDEPSDADASAIHEEHRWADDGGTIPDPDAAGG